MALASNDVPIEWRFVAIIAGIVAVVVWLAIAEPWLSPTQRMEKLSTEAAIARLMVLQSEQACRDAVGPNVMLRPPDEDRELCDQLEARLLVVQSVMAEIDKVMADSVRKLRR